MVSVMVTTHIVVALVVVVFFMIALPDNYYIRTKDTTYRIEFLASA